MSESAQFSKIDGSANRETIQREIDIAEDLWKIANGEGAVSRAVAWVLKQLSQEFPKHLVIDRPEDAQQASRCEKIKKSSRTDDIELPGWKEEGTVSVQHFERSLTVVPGLSGRAHGPAQLLINDWP